MGQGRVCQSIEWLAALTTRRMAGDRLRAGLGRGGLVLPAGPSVAGRGQRTAAELVGDPGGLAAASCTQVGVPTVRAPSREGCR
jgi:hypothetical protein